MLKKNSIVKFVFLFIIAVLGVLLCVLPFNVPASTNRYNGFLTSIEKSMDINGGVVAIYDCTLPNGGTSNLDQAIDNSIDKINKIFNTEGYNELNVVRQGNNKVRIEVAGALEEDRAFSYIEDYKEIKMTVQQLSDTVTDPRVFVDSSDIATAYPSVDYENSSHGIVVEFTSNGLTKLQELKDFASETSNSTIYVYLGELKSTNLLSEISVDNVNDNTMFLSASSNGSYTMSDATEAKEIAYSIVSGSLDVKLNFVESSYISPALGENTQLFIGIASLIVIVLSFVFLIVRYGDLGLLGALSMVFFLILYIFFLQAIPLVILNLSGVFGILLGFVIAIVSNIIIFEKIREEYSIGKKIHLACKGGFKKSLWIILDGHFLTLLTGIFIWIFAPVSLKCFAITLLIGTLLSMFTSLVMTRYFVNIYLPINSTKAKRMHLYRDKNTVELKDDGVEIIKEEANSAEGGGINE